MRHPVETWLDDAWARTTLVQVLGGGEGHGPLEDLPVGPRQRVLAQTDLPGRRPLVVVGAPARHHPRRQRHGPHRALSTPDTDGTSSGLA